MLSHGEVLEAHKASGTHGFELAFVRQHKKTSGIPWLKNGGVKHEETYEAFASEHFTNGHFIFLDAWWNA
jgi:uncharacterized protein related to proFAR isomerase